MIRVIICTALAMMVAGGLICLMTESIGAKHALPFALGVALTSGYNIIKLKWLQKVVEYTVTLDSAAAQRFILGHNLLRYLGMALVLAAAILVPDNIIHFYGAAVGIFTMPVAAYSMQFFMKRDLPESDAKSENEEG
jgi:hypothetical protein